MGLVDDDAAYGERVAEGGRARRFPRMQTDRMTGPLVAKDSVAELRRGSEIRDAVEREDRRELLTREWMLRPDAARFHDEEPRVVQVGPHEPRVRGDLRGA